MLVLRPLKLRWRVESPALVPLPQRLWTGGVPGSKAPYSDALDEEVPGLGVHQLDAPSQDVSQGRVVTVDEQTRPEDEVVEDHVVNLIEPLEGGATRSPESEAAEAVVVTVDEQTRLEDEVVENPVVNLIEPPEGGVTGSLEGEAAEAVVNED
ncbi:hypothetical protein U1Q18_008126 [Sarracenia purpurea var. burkii]